MAASKRSLPGVQRTDAFLFDPDTLMLIEAEDHPLYDARVKLPLDENLVRNIMVHGVIQPVVIRVGGDVPEVVDGRQRVKAAREANRRLIAEGKEPVRVPTVRRRGENSDLYGVLVSANEHRHADSPIEKAKKASKMLDLGGTEEEACIAFGWALPTLKAHLALLDVAAPVRKAVEQGELSVSAAAKLTSLPHPEQVETVAKVRAEGKPTVKKIAEAAGKTRTASAPGKKDIKRMIKALEGMSGEKAKWFAWGLEWAIGASTTAEVTEAGLALPEVE